MPKVIYEKRDRIGYVTLNRPEALNALDDELNDALWGFGQNGMRTKPLMPPS